MEGCLVCDLTAGRVPLPGGRIHERGGWIVEHCVGPPGVGTLVVKPRRHIVHVWDLDAAEAAELGPLLRDVAGAVAEFLDADQVYVCLWSHAGGRPVHIHWVVQPIPAGGVDGLRGPHLQAALFDRGEAPKSIPVEAVAERLRVRLAASARRENPPRVRAALAWPRGATVGRCDAPPPRPPSDRAARCRGPGRVWK